MTGYFRIRRDNPGWYAELFDQAGRDIGRGRTLTVPTQPKARKDAFEALRKRGYQANEVR